MKKRMEPPEMEFVVFDAADIIVTSGDAQFYSSEGMFNVGTGDATENGKNGVYHQ